MPAVQSLLDAHQRNALKAKKILEKARADALKSRGYHSAPARAKIRTEFAQRNGGMEAHDWQVDMGEALALGLDCSLIAGTGAGKTMPFVMPLFLESEKIIIIISPLNALEVDQAARFCKMGLSAVAVNGDTYSNAIHKEIQEFKHRVIITSPDMCLKHPKFRQLLSTPAFAKKIAAFVIDEAHCIAQWGDNFRAEYAELGTLRAFVPLQVPFMIASATLPPGILAEVRKSVHMSPDTSYHVNLGTDRPNIAWFVQHMKAGKTDLEALDFLTVGELIQSMVFFDDIDLMLAALEHLRALLPRVLRGAIAVYHSRRSKRSKRIIMEKFRKGEIKLLLTTEAAGMGCDIPHVEQVVQFMVPASLSIWMQRAGRAGRNILIFARAILLVQPSVFQEVAAKEGAEPTDNVTFKKTVESGLREWIETEGCRRDVVDVYFDNGTERTRPTGLCCDNCLRKASPNDPRLTLRAPSTTESDEETPVTYRYRRDEHLTGARELLTRFRTEKSGLSRRPYGIQAFMPDEVLRKLATRKHVKEIDDLLHAGWSPTHTKRYGAELLVLLDTYDTEFKREHEAAKKRRMDEQKAGTAKRRKLEKDEKAVNKALAPKSGRKSRAKPKPVPVLHPSAVLNLMHPPLNTFHLYATPTHNIPQQHLLPGPRVPQFPFAPLPPFPPTTPAPHLPFPPLLQFNPPASTPQSPFAPATPQPRLRLATQEEFNLNMMVGPSLGDLDPHRSNLPDTTGCFDTNPLAGPSSSRFYDTPQPPVRPNPPPRLEPQIPVSSDPDSLPQPLFFHDQSGAKLVPARLAPNAFYGTSLPPPFLRGHSSSFNSTPPAPQFLPGSSNYNVHMPHNNDRLW